MWQCDYELLNNGRRERFVPTRKGEAVPYAEVLLLWRDDEFFRGFFIGLLAQSRFSFFRWETPPISAETASRSFEFVLHDAPYLDSAPDTDPFAAHFAEATPGQDMTSFPSLGGDCRLIAPLPLAKTHIYVSLAPFIRQAPARQIDGLWRRVGVEMLQRLSGAPVWLSTAGDGVAWLHVRLDNRPKYYQFAPYRLWPTASSQGATG